MKHTTVVTGATGNVGSEVVRGLLARGRSIRVAVPRPKEAQRMFGNDPSYTRLVFGDAGTYGNAFRDAQALFLVRPPQITNVKRDIIPALEAAKEAGVQHVVFISLQGVERNRVVPHRRVEDYLKTYHGPAWTFLRPSFFMQNLATTHRDDIRDRDEVFVPAGRGRTSFIDVRDVAAVAVKVLDEAGHQGRAYELTGRNTLDYSEVARILSEVAGRDIRYTNPSPWRFWYRMRERGQPAGYVGVMIALYTVCRLGLAAGVTEETERLLGRAPISFRQFAEDYVTAWQQLEKPVVNHQKIL